MPEFPNPSELPKLPPPRCAVTVAFMLRPYDVDESGRAEMLGFVSAGRLDMVKLVNNAMNFYIDQLTKGNVPDQGHDRFVVEQCIENYCIM